MSSGESTPQAGVNLGRYMSAFALVGLICLVISLMGIFGGGDEHAKTQMAGSYLFAFIFWITVTLGCLGLTLLSNSVRARWVMPIIRILESGSSPVTLIGMAALFIPILAVIWDKVHGVTLYPWLHEHGAPPTHLQEQVFAKYLNPQDFTLRFILYFVIWALFSGYLRASARRQEQNGDRNEGQKRSNVASPGIVFFVIACTFAFTDWVMSLVHGWNSTMYGVWFVTASGLSALAIAVLMVMVNAKREPYDHVVTPTLGKDLGNLLFALSMFWAYTAFSQYLIIWNGNIPEYAQYYASRTPGWWNAIGLVTILGQFFIPWFYLLIPKNKSNPKRLAPVAGWIFVIHIVDVYYNVVPSLHGRETAMPMWTDLVAFLGIGGIWALLFSMQIRREALVPAYDPTPIEEPAHA